MLDLLPASFDGLPFEVEAESASVAPRIAEHAILDGPTITESMGFGAETYQITGYFAADGAEAAATVALAVMNTAKGLLILPAMGPVMVRPKSCKPSRKKQRRDYLALDLEFVAAGPTLGSMLSAGLGRVATMVADGAATVAAGVKGALGL